MAENNSSTEIDWRPIPGFSGYRVNNHGELQSAWTQVRNIGHHPGFRHFIGSEWTPLQTFINYRGYRVLGLHQNNGIKHVQVARLVLLAFVGPPPDGMECCHNDGNPLNNLITNLRWDTPAANQHDRIAHGTMLYGEDHPHSKLNNVSVRAIRQLHLDGNDFTSIGKKYGVHRTTIRRVVRGTYWKHIK